MKLPRRRSRDRKVACRVLTALVCAAGGCTTSPGPSGRPVVIRDVTVIPMDTNRVLTRWTVVVTGGRIQAMGPTVDVPSNATVIDGRGRYLLPGLADLHVHVEKDFELSLYVANGVTTVFNLKGRPWHLDLRARLDSGQMLGPRLFTCGPYIQDIESPDVARRRIAEVDSAGYDCAKIRGEWSEAAYLAASDEARTRELMLIGHAPRNQSFDLVLRGGYERIAHLEELVYTTPELDAYIERYRGWTGELPDDDPTEELGAIVSRLARATREAGIWVIPTEVVINHYFLRNTAFEGLYGRPYMRYLDPIAARRWRTARQDDRAARFLQQVRLQELLLRTLADEGVKMALGTDAETISVLMTMPGWSAHEELELMVRAGLTPYDALRMATADAATFLGVEDAGTIRQGTRADLLLLAGNPLEDIRHTTEIVGVVLNGRWLPQDTLAAMLSAVAQRHEPIERRLAIVDRMLEAEGPEAAARTFLAEGRDSVVGGYLQSAVNAIGYRLLRAGRLDSAIAAFRVNVETFPESANAYDSYGEAYVVKGDTARAISEYRRALAVDPHFTNARRMLERLGADAIPPARGN